MRIVVTSDLHYCPAHAPAIEAWVPRLKALKADLLILAGDNAEGPELFEDLLELMDDVAPEKAALAGNHDVWSAAKRGGPDSAALRDYVLQEVADQAGWRWLERDTWRHEGLSVVGSMAWYDYSAGDKTLGHTPETYARLKRTVNADAWKIDWPESDLEVAAKCRAGLLERLRAEAARSDCEEVLVITHVPLFEPAMVRVAPDGQDPSRWAFGNAYFGNLSLGHEVAAEQKVKCVISGHSHFGGRWQVPRVGAPLHTEVVASDYGQPAWVVIDR